MEQSPTYVIEVVVITDLFKPIHVDGDLLWNTLVNVDDEVDSAGWRRLARPVAFRRRRYIGIIECLDGRRDSSRVGHVVVTDAYHPVNLNGDRLSAGMGSRAPSPCSTIPATLL